MMKRRAMTILFAASMLAQGARAGAAADAEGAKAKARAAAEKSDEVALRAAQAAKAERWSDALDLMREAYRLDPAPRWLYDMAVLQDHLGECDEAAFLYRAALWGKGIAPQDQDAVDKRLAALEEQCHFKKRHIMAVDRHARAARYLDLKLCTLAGAVLTGIATAAEKAQVQQCQAENK